MSANATISPQSIESERALLGTIILDGGEHLDELAGKLTPEAFYRPDHGRLFRELLTMRRAGIPIDRVVLGERVLGDGHQGETFGGYGYVLSLPEHAPARAAWRSYADTVWRRHVARLVAKAARELANRAASEPDDTDGMLAEVQALAYSVAGVEAADDDLVWIGDAARKAVERIEAVSNGDPGAAGVPMPFRALSAVIPYLQPGEMYVIGARPKMGKSALARCIAEHVGSMPPVGDRDRRPAVAVFSFEMDDVQIASLSLANFADLDATDVRLGRLDQRAWDSLYGAATELREASILLYSGPSLTVEDLGTRVRRAKRKSWEAGHELRMIVVDYLQIMASTPGHDRNGNERIGHISRNLKLLARNEKVAALVLSQLSRSVEDRSNKVPIPSDLRDSGAIEQDAAAILFPYRPAVYDPGADPSEVVIHIPVQRYGAPGEARMRWTGSRTRFSDRDDNDIRL